MEINVSTVEETQALAKKLAEFILPGDTILLDGELGAGKTTFTQGFAKALGIKRPLKSPTFTLVREYQTTSFPLYHLDVYRLGEEGGGDELGLSDYFGSDGVAFVEWSQFIENELPNNWLKISLRRVTSDPTGMQRVISLSSNGPRGRQLAMQLGE
jgi:tRNA threonylcarbamoyladenosine biosynthesis protein TsaE